MKSSQVQVVASRADQFLPVSDKVFRMEKVFMTERNDSNFPLVSCVVTCYKKVPYLYEALESVLKQDYPRIELLVTDDGTEGFPTEEIRAYIANNKGGGIERYVVHHNEVNVGTVKNMNGMLEISEGDYFINLDGDDVFYDNTVISQVVQRFRETNVDLLSCGRMLCDTQMKPIKLLPDQNDIPVITKLNTAKKQFHSFAVFRFHNIASGSAMYFSRACMERVGMFDESYRQWQDGPWLTKYVQQGKMIPTAYDIVAVKYRDGGVSNNKKLNLESSKHLSKDWRHFIDQFTVSDRSSPYVLRRRYYVFYNRWDQSKNIFQKMWLLLLYPERACNILWSKVKRVKKR